MPTSTQSGPIGLDIIACELLEQGDGELPARVPETEQEVSVAADSDAVLAQTATGLTGMESKPYMTNMYMTFDFNKFDQAVDLSLLSVNGAEDRVPFGSDFALSGSIQSTEVGHQSDRDLQKDKQNLNSWSESKISSAETQSCQADSKISGSLGQHSSQSQPRDFVRGLHVYKNQEPRFMEGSVASSSGNISVSSHSENLATRTQASAVATPVANFSSGQQMLSTPVFMGEYTQVRETDVKTCSRTGSVKSGTCVLSDSEGESSDTALSIDAPEFKPSLMPTPATAFPPQPRFCMPRFSPNLRLPNQPGFPPNIYFSPLHQSEPPMPMAKMFGLKSQLHSQNATVSRLVGPNLFLPPNQYRSPAPGKQNGSTGSMNYSAAAQNPVPTASPALVKSPPSPSASDLSKKSPAVEKIERHILNGGKLLVLMRGLPGSGKSHLARYIAICVCYQIRDDVIYCLRHCITCQCMCLSCCSFKKVFKTLYILISYTVS